MSEAKIGALAPWYGANRMLAHEVGRELRGLEWVGIPFAGSMAEVQHITARAIVVNDLHRHIVNLAFCIQHRGRRQELIESLARAPFHPDMLDAARRFCKEFAGHEATGDIQWAHAYFVCSWMNRSGLAGTDGEFRGALPIRWSATGGDSNTRFRSAIDSLEAWGKTMQRCNFSTLDWRDFLAKCKDKPKHGIYCDPPFPGPGDKYTHRMPEPAQRELAAALGKFTKARVVCRFYDHPLVRELYPEGQWTWRRLKGRDGNNNAEKPEVLIINGRSYA